MIKIYKTLYDTNCLLNHNLSPVESPFLASFLEKIWADADSTLATVQQSLARLNPVGTNDSHIMLGSWNTEYLWQAKANHFLDSYLEVINKHHLLALQEVSPQGIIQLAKHCGYNYAVSQANTRGQAVGFLIHPRFIINNISEYTELANVYGIPNLRPALRVDIIDRQSKMPLSIVNVHLKSMIGRLSFTSQIRQKQLRQLMTAMQDNQSPTIIVGDFNCFLDTTLDTAPLINNEYILANQNNHTSTQSCGGRLDGLFYRDLSFDFKPKHYNIRNFWRRNSAGRSLSDHGLLTWKIGH